MMKAINIEDCPGGGGDRCRCEICACCGYRKHAAIHGPVWRTGKLMDEPYGGHEFKPKRTNCTHDRLNEDGICRTCGEDRRGL